jgi:hypothetical protein
LNSGTLIEVKQVGAASKQYVLAVIDDLARAGVLIRRGAPAEIRATFEK